MVFNWDTSGANSIRNLMLPVQSPYYMKVSTEDGRDLLWFVRKRGEKIAEWVTSYVNEELVRWKDFKTAQLMLAHVTTQPDLPKLILAMGETPGNYKVKLVYLRDHEIAASTTISIAKEE
ncbi:hypothetical protein [Pseudomonas phage vB_PaeM_PS119XW]|uniref:Uncharacterized protein n=1 Tax=Pseudomonas phage vB_PaeM_PS119XW TaxID=2601632 RepID=A0A5C1K8D8_9CAUD|nr:hypothetical protein PP933_gp340 [Pseudomonas phage vB_PaeM_PS119XW]QEM42069.1 hypothetical protein [Pseudomonas phage vB_PaeM_PS119XW]